MKLTLPVHLEEAAGADDKLYYVLQERMSLDSVDLVANGEIANDGTHFVTFTVYGNDGATAAFVWSTETGKEGIIQDKTLKSLTRIQEKPFMKPEQLSMLILSKIVQEKQLMLY